jgi:hypothetical protein
VKVKPYLIQDIEDGLFYSPTIDVSGYETMKGVFVPQADNVTLTIEVSDDGLSWTTFDTIVLPKKYYSVHYAIDLPKSHIRFKATSNVGTMLILKGATN